MTGSPVVPSDGNDTQGSSKIVTDQGVTGFDSGRRGRGSGPRMSGYLVNDPLKETAAKETQPATGSSAYALAA